MAEDKKANIEYLLDNNLNNIAGAEKIKLAIIEKNKTDNPFTSLFITVADSEALDSGGSITRFKKQYGVDLPTRKKQKRINNHVDYADGFKFGEDVVLTISDPFQTDHYPVDPMSIAMMDNIGFDTKGIAQVANSLVKAEIKSVADTFVNNDKSIKVNNKSLNAYETTKSVKKHITNFMSMNSNNSFWPAETLKLFVGQRYNFNKSNLKILMNPKDNLNLTNALTDGGMASDAIFDLFIEGELKKINGVDIIITPWIDEGTIFITPTEMIGQPDPAFVQRTVWTQTPPLQGKLKVTYGISYIDSIMVFPELVIEIAVDTDTSSSSVEVPTATFGEPTVVVETAPDADNGSINIDVTPINCDSPKAQLYYLGESSSSQGQGTLIASDVTLTNDTTTDSGWTGLSDGMYKVEVVDNNFDANSSIASVVISLNPTISTFTKQLDEKDKALKNKEQIITSSNEVIKSNEAYIESLVASNENFSKRLKEQEVEFKQKEQILIKQFTDKLNQTNNSNNK